jgi:predicted nucleic acid-binding protein
MTAFFDTSAVIALYDKDHEFHKWSDSVFQEHKKQGPIIICNVVYAELSIGLKSKNDVDEIVNRYGFQRSNPDDEALFEAGRRYIKYKKDSKAAKAIAARGNVLPDFFIGAHAQRLKVPLVTANPTDFRSFFSGLKVVHPKGEFIVMGAKK